MILTIAGADFSGANIGQNNSVTITLNKTGANGSKSSVTLKKDESVSTETVIATGLSLQTGYENLVVTVTMTGTGDVSGWYSNGVVTIPSDTLITGNITIKATASKIATGGGEVVDPEEPGTGGDTPGDNVQSNVSYITRVTNNVNIVDGKSVGNTGGYSEDQNYLSYEYTIPYNGTIYFDSSVTAIYIALWHSGTNTRYRKSENNLPSQENSLAVAAGDRIIATLTKSTASSFKLVYKNELGSTYTEQLIVSKSDMTIHENQTAGENGLTASEYYNSWELDFGGKEFEKGYLYMSDFATYYTALLILSANGNVRYRVNSSEDTLPKDIQTIVPVTSNDTIYVSESKTNSKEFKIHFLTED